MRSNPLPHQHTSPSSSLKHIIHTLNLQRRTLLVRPSPYSLRHAFRLLARDKGGEGWVRGGWAQVGFAPDEDDGDLGAAY